MPKKEASRFSCGDLGLQESELISYLQLESSILKFVDFRFRPFVSVSEEEIKKYYETRLIPQLQKAKLEIPPLAQVSTRIEEILREEEVNALLDQWIKEVRRSSRIENFDAAGGSRTLHRELEAMKIRRKILIDCCPAAVLALRVWASGICGLTVSRTMSAPLSISRIEKATGLNCRIERLEFSVLRGKFFIAGLALSPRTQLRD